MFESEQELRGLVQKLIPKAKQWFDKEVGALNLEDEEKFVLIFVTCRLLSLVAKKSMEEQGWELCELNEAYFKKDPNERGN